MPGAIYRQPPNPFIGGRQPLEPYKQTPPSRIYDDPPFNQHDRVSLDVVLRAWQPYRGPLPQQRRPTQIVSVDDPPFDAPSILHQLLASWQPGPWLPQPLQRQLVQGAPLAADDPPFGLKTQLWLVIRAWQLPPDVVQRYNKIVQEAAAAANTWPGWVSSSRGWF